MTPEQWLARALRTAREALGMSQENVAQAMSLYDFNWRQTTVQKTEAASRPIRVNEAIALAEVLRIHPADLLGDIRDDWAHHGYLLTLAARQQRLDDRYRMAEEQLRDIAHEREDHQRRLEEAQAAHAEACRRRERNAASAQAKPQQIRLQKYEEARQLIAPLREGNVIILQIGDMSPATRKRTVDFAAGMAAGAGGSITRVKDFVFLICPPDIDASEVIDAHLQEIREA